MKIQTLNIRQQTKKDEYMNEPLSPTKHERQIRFADMKLMKQQILDIRERKQSIPIVEQPLIVKSFEQLYKIKANEIKKRLIMRRIQQKQKQYSKINAQLTRYKQKYQQKQRQFKQKQHIFKVLTQKLQIQFQKTKTTFRDVGFNRSITSGVRKLNYYRVAEILFNENARKIFSSLENASVGANGSNSNNDAKWDEEVGICLGYLGLLISIVGEISGARVWFQFAFRGSKSTVRLSDGSTVVLRPRQPRFSQAISTCIEQLYQIMQNSMGIKSPKSKNLFQMCQQLSKVIIS